jgi:1,4-alpha-glucan branching enzyme
LYRSEPALHENDCMPEGFAWIDCHDSDNSIISYIRRAKDPEDFVVVVCNFTPIARDGYRIGVPVGGPYAELLNTDAGCYEGSGVGNAGRVDAEAQEAHGHPFSLNLSVPPLGAVVMKPFPKEKKTEKELPAKAVDAAAIETDTTGDGASKQD